MNLRPLSDIITPCLMVDEARMRRNVQRLSRHLASHGVSLRPHLKTCKNIELARYLLDGQPGSVTVSTLAEADYFRRHGLNGILYAVGIAPGKLDQVLDRIEAGMDLTVILDHVDTAAACRQAASRRGLALPVMIEIDADGQRAGIQPSSADLLEIAGALGAECPLRGVMVHAGGSYGCPSPEAIVAMAEQERLAAVTAAERLRKAGHECPIVSVGSTPTAMLGQNFAGVTEVRAGVHIFQDLVMAGLGVCTTEDIALSVLAEVIGHRPDQRELLIDAGWMALSRDTGRAPGAPDWGYGLVRGGRLENLGDLAVVACNQEHGIVRSLGPTPIDLGHFPVGTRLRVLPNHACATGAQHDGYWLDNGNGNQLTWLDRCRGW